MVQPSVFTDVFVPVGDILVAGTVLGGIAVASRGAARSAFARWSYLALAAAIFAAWYGGVSYLAKRGVFLAGPDVRFPLLPVAVFLPVILGLAILPRSRFVANVLDATPLSSLVGVQTLRVLGVVFLVEWALGSLPGVFALPAAIGDIATGLLAFPVASLAARKSPWTTSVVYSWTALGLADFVSALATGFLSSPGRFQILALDHPNLIASADPLVLIPVFGVPLFMLLHAITIWKLRRSAARLAPLALAAQSA